MIFVLGLREDERRVLQSTLASWGCPVDELPQIVVADSSSVTDRAAMYARGGVFLITSRILIVDLLQGTANARDIEGILVAHAEKVDGESTEAFILRIFRNHRNFMGGGGGFIKAFTDDPAQLVSGFAKVDKILKALQVQKMYLSVSGSLSTHRSPTGGMKGRAVGNHSSHPRFKSSANTLKEGLPNTRSFRQRTFLRSLNMCRLKGLLRQGWYL